MDRTERVDGLVRIIDVINKLKHEQTDNRKFLAGPNKSPEDVERVKRFLKNADENLAKEKEQKKRFISENYGFLGSLRAEDDLVLRALRLKREARARLSELLEEEKNLREENKRLKAEHAESDADNTALKDIKDKIKKNDDKINSVVDQQGYALDQFNKNKALSAFSRRLSMIMLGLAKDLAGALALKNFSNKKALKASAGIAKTIPAPKKDKAPELQERNAFYFLKRFKRKKSASPEDSAASPPASADKQKNLNFRSLPVRLKLALVLAFTYDVADALITIFTLGSSEAFEWMINIPFEIFFLILIWQYVSFKKLRGWLVLLATLSEFLMWIDTFPFYTLVALFVIWEFKNHSALKSDAVNVKKSANTKKQGAGRAESTVNKIFISASNSKAGRRFIALVFIAVLCGAFFIMFPLKVHNAVDSANDFFAKGEYKLLLTKVKGNINSAIDKFVSYIAKQKEIAISGDVFAGEVENAKSRGLSLVLDKVDYPFTTASESIYISGSLSGRALDPDMCGLVGETCGTEEDNKITLSCYTNKNEKGVVAPGEVSFLNLEYSSAPLSCEFKDGAESWNFKASPDKRVVYVAAEFNFLTAGYARKQFVSETKLRELSRRGYVFEKAPPKYTPGPVSVKFLQSFVDKAPVVVGENALPVKVGVTIENSGEGDIVKFNKVVFILPNNGRLLGCNAPAKQEGDKLVFDVEKMNGPQFEIKSGKTITFMCDISFGSDVLDVNNEVTVDFFEVMLNYKYSVRKSVNVEVSAQEAVMPLEGNDAFCPVASCSCSSGFTVQKGFSCGGRALADVEKECIKLGIDECAGNSRCVWKAEGFECKAKV